MKKNAIYSYVVLLIFAVLMRVYPAGLFDYIVPVYLLAMPLIFAGRFNFSFVPRHISLGLIVSAGILVPFYILFHKTGQAAPVTVNFVLIQLFAVSLPEEVFFRGFLQSLLGNDLKAVFIVSSMFAAAHLPAFIFSGDSYALITFFPSLVMGFLYLKTSNILPSIIFHFFANMVFFTFVI